MNREHVKQAIELLSKVKATCITKRNEFIDEKEMKGCFLGHIALQTGFDVEGYGMGVMHHIREYFEIGSLQQQEKLECIVNNHIAWTADEQSFTTAKKKALKCLRSLVE